MAKPRARTWQQVRSKKKPTTVTVDVVADSELADELAQLRATAGRLAVRSKARPADTTLAAEAADAEDAVDAWLLEHGDDAVIRFTMLTIGRHAFEELIDQHPPDKAEQKEAGQRLPWNAATFTPAIIHACAVVPQYDDEDPDRVTGYLPMFDSPEQVADEMWNDSAWSQAELGRILQAALDCNMHLRTVNLGKGGSG